MDHLAAFVILWPGTDLVAFQAHLMSFALGGSLWIGTPTYKLHYDSKKWHRCIQFHFGLFFFFIDILIPLWAEYEAGDPK